MYRGISVVVVVVVVVDLSVSPLKILFSSHVVGTHGLSVAQFLLPSLMYSSPFARCTLRPLSHGLYWVFICALYLFCVFVVEWAHLFYLPLSSLGAWIWMCDNDPMRRHQIPCGDQG